MRHFAWTWRSSDGLNIYAQSWEPGEHVEAVICLVHGLGEHGGRYAHLAAALGQAGCATITFDHRGHGQSGGPRGHAPSYDALMDDIARLLDEAARRFPGRPRLLYGHSLGGNLVLNYALRRRPDLAGVIVTGPWLRTAFAPPAWKVALGRAVNNIWPALAQPSGLDTNALSRDPAVAQAYNSDPAVHERISARLFVICYAAGQWALDHAAEFPLPLLLMHGGDDRITSPDASREFAARAPNCTLKIWDGHYHEIHNEPEQHEVFAFTRDWLRAHIRPGSQPG